MGNEDIVITRDKPWHFEILSSQILETLDASLEKTKTYQAPKQSNHLLPF